MDERGLRRFLRELLLRLDLRPPLTAADLCDRLGWHRGRPIVLVPRTLPGPAGFGAVVSMPAKDLIVHSDSGARQYREAIIFHEVVHLVRGHVTDTGHAAGLLCRGPSPAPDGTGYYDCWQEWEAETGAAIFAEWSGAQPVVDVEHTAVDRAELAISHAFGTGDWS